MPIFDDVLWRGFHMRLQFDLGEACRHRNKFIVRVCDDGSVSLRDLIRSMSGKFCHYVE